MDWLRKSLRAEEELGKEKEEEKHEGGEEREKEGGNKGGGVKEDLSEITRHIWGGVASFLAPPPPPPPPPPPVSQRVLKQEEEVSIEEVKTEETHVSLSTLTDLGEVNLGSQQEEGEEKEGYSGEVKLTSGRGDQILTGVCSDLAELKGSVATGLSRFIKAVRVEIEGEEEEEEEERRKGEKDKKEDRRIRQNQAGDSKTGAFNSALNPLYGSILPQQEDNDDGEEAGMKRGGSIDDLISGGLEGVSKLASSLFPRVPPPTLSDSEAKVEPRVVGVTEEVLMWAKNISTHPETWLDFPHPLDDPDGDDFVLSSAQKEHIEAVESATHRLAALRIELCPDYMSEGRFWKIYFVLLYSRLNKQDAHLLSTPQVLVARNHLLHELQKEDSHAHRNESAEINTTSSASLSSETIEKTKLISMQSAAGSVSTNDLQCPPGEERSPPVNMREEKTEEEVQNKSVLPNTLNIKEEKKEEEEEEEVDEWPDEEPSSTTLHCTRVGSNEEDVSFSDLEEEEEEEGSATISVDSKHLQSFSPKRAPQGLNEVEKEPLLPSTSSTSASASASTNTMNEVEEEPLLPSKSSTSASASASTNTSTSSSSTKNKADSGEPSDWLTIDEEYLASANLY